jgi:hypothetical protein
MSTIETQKTITIGGKKYTAARLRNLPSQELKGGDTMVTTPDGLQVAYRLHSNAVAVLNFGALHRPGSLGGLVALLSL